MLIANHNIRSANIANSKSQNSINNLKPQLLNSRILLVEDNLINQKIEILILNDIGVSNIDIACNGNEAVILSNLNDYSLILLDIGLPGINGFKVSQYIRNNTKNHNTPIIAISAYTKDDIEDKCYISGINYILSKPINLDVLREAVLKWIEKN